MKDREDRDPEERDEQGAERPTPVRRGLPSARPTPVRRRDPSGPDAGDEDPERPTPVRQAMEVERDEPPPVEAPSLRFFRGDEEWIARVEGRTTAGSRKDAGAPLLLLSFARADEPDRRIREGFAVGRSLEAVPPGELGRLLDASRPYREEWEGGELFPETRRDRSSGR